MNEFNDLWGPLFGPPPGEKRKAEGQERVMRNERQFWKDRAQETIILLLKRKPEISSVDLRVWAAENEWEDPHSPNCWGAAFTAARMGGIIEVCGYIQSAISSRHAGLIRLWRRK